MSCEQRRIPKISDCHRQRELEPDYPHLCVSLTPSHRASASQAEAVIQECIEGNVTQFFCMNGVFTYERSVHDELCEESVVAEQCCLRDEARSTIVRMALFTALHPVHGIAQS